MLCRIVWFDKPCNEMHVGYSMHFDVIPQKDDYIILPNEDGPRKILYVTHKMLDRTAHLRVTDTIVTVEFLKCPMSEKRSPLDHVQSLVQMCCAGFEKIKLELFPPFPTTVASKSMIRYRRSISTISEIPVVSQSIMMSLKNY